jgi:hypothetical protein
MANPHLLHTPPLFRVLTRITPSPRAIHHTPNTPATQASLKSCQQKSLRPTPTDTLNFLPLYQTAWILEGFLNFLPMLQGALRLPN